MKGKSKRTGPTEDWKARLNRLHQSFLTLWNKEFAEAKARGAELLRSYGAEGLFITREKTVMMTEGFPAFSLLLDSYTLEE